MTASFHYAGKPTACMQGTDPHDRIIYIGTFTKSLFPGLRIGYVAQLTLARSMAGGRFGAYVRTMRAVYDERLDCWQVSSGKHLSDFIEPRIPVGGLQVPCAITCGLSERIAVDAARHAGIELIGLSALHHAGGSKAGFPMGFAAYTPREIEIAVKRLANALRAATNP